MANGNQADEVYIVQLIAETKGAIKNTEKWRKEIDAMKRHLLELRNESGMALDDVAHGFIKAAEKSAVFSENISFVKKVVRQASKEIRAVDKAMDKATREMESGQKEASGFGKIMEIAFGVSLGNIAVKALEVATRLLRNFVREIQRGIQEAGKFSEDVARLNVNLRAFQRTGGDLSADEIVSLMEEIGNEFTTFTEQELVEATQELLHWGRQLDLTGKQVQELLDVSARMSVIMGQDLPTSIRQVTTAAITGRTQSLRPYGVALDGTSIKTLALKQNLIEEGEELDNNTKLLIILQETHNALNEIMGETSDITKSLGGQQETISSSWVNLRKDIAEGVAPALKVINRWIIRIITGFNAFVDAIKTLDVALSTFSKTTLRAVTVRWQNFWRSLRGQEKIEFDFFEKFDKTFQELEGKFFPLRALQNEARGMRDTLVDEAEEMSKELADKYKKLGIKIRELLIDQQDDIEEENEDFQQKLGEMERDFAEDRAVERIKFGNDIAKINRKFRDRLAELNEDYREEERQREEDYFEDLMRLREDFLLDLEGALQERNAKQIVSLIKQFNLRRRQLERQKELEDKQREREFEDRVAQLRRERKIRLREARIEFQERMRLLRRQYEFERRQQEIAHQQRIDDIKEETDIRIEELKRKFEDEERITDEGAQIITDILESHFGPGGRIDKIYDFLVEKTGKALKAVRDRIMRYGQELSDLFNDLNDQLSGPLPGPGPDNPYWSEPGYPGMAEGGTIIADQPTTVTFGEAGPEKATFEPIGRVGQNENSVFTSGDPSSLSGGGGKMMVELFLSPDLEARIVNKSLSEAADVMIKQRRR